MQQVCSACGIIIQTGEKFRAEFEGIYRQVPSVQVFAVPKTKFEYVEGTIRHAKCPIPIGG